MNKNEPTKKRILIVDDDAAILDAVSLILEDFGYSVSAVEKGEEAVPQAITFKPDVILLDVLMSGVDGREICAKLKKNKGTKNIPVIMLSAHPGVAQKINEIKAEGFLAKPFEVGDLISTIEKYLK